MPARQYDELYQRAQRARMTIGEVVRRSLRRDVHRSDDVDDDDE
jgi:hypothetical protein